MEEPLDEFTQARLIDKLKNMSDEDLERALSNLTQLERNVLSLRHGLRNPRLPKDKKQALTYIAKEFAKTKARIKELEEKARGALK